MIYSETDAICELRDAELRYTKGLSVGPIDLAVYPGEIVGLKGENGSGKSSVIRLLAGTVKPAAGVRELQRGAITGLDPQDIALYPTLTARQNLSFFAGACGMVGKRRRARVSYLLKLVKLEKFASKRVSTFSGGMKRRLNLAAALTITPDLLLLDEPTVGADEDSRKIILDVARHIADIGGAVVVVSHLSGELEDLCSRMLTMCSGRIVREEHRERCGDDTK